MLHAMFSGRGEEVRVCLVCDRVDPSPRVAAGAPLDPGDGELLDLDPGFEGTSWRLLVGFANFVERRGICAIRKPECHVGYFSKADAAVLKRWLLRQRGVQWE